MDQFQPDDADVIKATTRLMDATSGLAAWWTMVEAEKELVDNSAYPDDTVVLHYMGCGASTQITAKELRDLREARNNLYTVMQKLSPMLNNIQGDKV